METNAILASLWRVVDAIAAELHNLSDWETAGDRPGQYQCDIVADKCGVELLVGDGFGVLSEESGMHHADRPLVAVIDPVDGSTNATQGLPWFATSICVLDAAGPLVSVVVNQSSGVRYHAVREKGAHRDGLPIKPSSTTALSDAIVGLSGYPQSHLGWRQYRVLGAAALDLCAVAEGTLDAYIDCDDAHGAWDYLGGIQICNEAGAATGDVYGRDLIVVSHSERRAPVAGSGTTLRDELVASLKGSKSL